MATIEDRKVSAILAKIRDSQTPPISPIKSPQKNSQPLNAPSRKQVLNEPVQNQTTRCLCKNQISRKLSNAPKPLRFDRQRQFTNRSTGSRFVVNASRYTENLINHLSLDGSTHRKSICETLIKYFASNCQGLLKMLSIRLESNDSSQLKSTRHTRSRFARHLENILQVTTKWG